MSRGVPTTGSETLEGQDGIEGDVSRRPDGVSGPPPGPAVLLIPTPAPAPTEPSTRRGRRRALGLVVPVALVALWALAGAAGMISPRLLPSPAAVAEAGWDFVAGESTVTLPGVVPFDGAAARHVSASVARWLSGFALGVGVGVPLGLALGLSRRAGELLDPLVQGLRSIPITAWLPIILVWFGLSEGAARYLVFIGALFPIVIATADSAARVPRPLVDTALMLGTSRSALARESTCPRHYLGSSPGCASGSRSDG